MDRLVIVAVLVLGLGVPSLGRMALANTSKHSAQSSKHSTSTTKHTSSSSKHGKHLASGTGKSSHKGHLIASSSSGNRHSRRHHKNRSRHQHVVAHHYAYPMDMFLLSPPGFTSDVLPSQLASEVKEDFKNGIAGAYPASALVQSGLIDCLPLHGGIFWRRQPVKYLIMHSTESVIPRNAPQIVNGWNSLGRRHAGAQYIVDRDGRIYQTVDPDLATVHVNIFKTLPGINNDNSIGIEMVHAGRQQYTHDQIKSVVHLVVYLLQRYQIDQSNLITHRYAQQGDHTDPVAFDWNSFVSQVGKLQKHAMAKQMVAITEAMKEIPANKTAANVASTSTTNKSQALSKSNTSTTASGAAEAAVIQNVKTDSVLRPPVQMDPSAANSLLQTK